MVDSQDAITFHPRPAHSGAHRQKNRRSINDRLRVAIAMYRRSVDRRSHRRADSRHGGKTMRKMKQTLNAQRSTLNAESRRDFELDVGRWTLARDLSELDVGRFLL